ncbi:MAG: hypothetical protein G01um101430_456 [Parcubacteria group bacterium Gr01-1014_30]|nr:MAG: hypothetical protein G01um101430_456 [Parcubacteria group bacterium Gr01-1014_30]
MQITWKGQACFQITAVPDKNSQVKIVIDPYSEEIGLRLPKLEADIVLSTHNHYDHNNVKAISPSAGALTELSRTSSGQAHFLVEGPGEYEAKGVIIQGIHSWHDEKEGAERGSNTIYTLEAEDLRLCHLGDLGQKELTSEQLEKIGQVDILMIPVGGVYTIDAKGALKVMSQIEPKIAIPMHYALPKLKVKLDGIDKFLKEVGLKRITPEAKLVVKKKDLSEEEAKIVLLQP